VPKGLVELVGRGPPDVGAALALSAVETVVRDGVQDANVAAAQALDPEGSHLSLGIGAQGEPMTLERGMPLIS
jgi:hypothetical protein